jgi:nodulation protein F
MGVDGHEPLDALGESILARIREHSEEPSSINLDTPLSHLGIHSLELTEIIFDLEEDFGIEIEMNTAQAWENLEKVRDIVEAVRTLVNAKS